MGSSSVWRQAGNLFWLVTCMVIVAGVSLLWPKMAGKVEAVGLNTVITGLTQPVAIAHAGDATGRIFVVQQTGRIVVFNGIQVLPTPFLDLTSVVLCCGERGLLGLAFHPNYAGNGLFYVNYTRQPDGATVIARYQVSQIDPNQADPTSQVSLLTIAQPFANHNGGQLQFGPDGYLYIGMGDGGSGGDPNNEAQNMGSLLGKLLRIDVDSGAPYGIPATNPFVGSPGIRDEIWASGLRNPWRFSFDSVTGDLFIGDVGQGQREEINYQPPGSTGGANYGWRRMEGSLCFNPATGCNDGTLTLPIMEYAHTEGCSVTGGYRYRGQGIPGLHGWYLFGDYCSGRVWGAIQDGDGAWQRMPLLDSGFFLSTFGEGEDGELYLADHVSGTIAKLVAGPVRDLTAQFGSVIRLARRGRERLTFPLIIQNAGTTILSQSVVMQVYLSDDAVMDPADRLIWSRRILLRRVPMGGVVRTTGRAIVTGSTQGRYLLAVIDATNILPESNEANNTASMVIP